MEETKNTNEKEIDLLALGKKIWDRKKFILKVMGIGAVIGLIVAFSIPEEYTTTVTLISDSQSANSGTISSLASLAGININNTPDKDALASPNLYPSIFNSTSFLKGLLDIQVKEEGADMSLYTYMQKHQKKPWWNYIIAVPSKISAFLIPLPSDEARIKNDSIMTSRNYIPKAEISVMNTLSSRFSVSFDKKIGITTVDVTMQNPDISSFLADTLTSYLQSYIIQYRTQKARVDLQHTEKLYEESKENYYKAQSKLADFIDGNMNVVSARYKTMQEKLQNEANLAFTVYNQTAQQLQMAKIKVQNTIPVFTIIQPAVKPLYPAAPQKRIIVIGFLFLSFVGASIWIVRKDITNILLDNN